MQNPLLDLWAGGGNAVNAWLSIPSTFSAEIMARQGFDSFTIDLQHGLVDYQMALTMMQAISFSDKAIMARVPWMEPGIVMKILDAGAHGIICPMINTAEEAEAFVGACQYSPRGYRSSGPTRAVMVHGGDYVSQANDKIITLAMVETKQALENVEEIAATPGLTGIYVGPGDLGLSLGYEPKLDQTEPAVVDAIDRILAATQKAGIYCGIHCLTPGYIKQVFGKGFHLATLASDVRLLSSSAADQLAETKT